MAAEAKLQIPVLTEAVADFEAEPETDADDARAGAEIAKAHADDLNANADDAENAKTNADDSKTADDDAEAGPSPAAAAGRPLPSDPETLIAELQTQIAASAFALTDDILRSAFAEMEASVFERITSRLRCELPEIVDQILRERLGEETDY